SRPPRGGAAKGGCMAGQPTAYRNHPSRFRRTAGATAAAAAVVVAALTTAPAHAVTATAFVRVNQIGYSATSQAKRAYLMASGVETGATFDVRNSSNTTVFS